MTETAIGIDLGTTNSVVAFTDPSGVTTTIAGPDGARVVPSVVYFPPDGSDPIVGVQAAQRVVVEPDRCASLFKRGMGTTTFLDTDVPFVVDGKTWAPEELSALVLSKLVGIAEAHLGHRPAKAFITVPAYFGEPERAATRQAAEIAGLPVARVVNEPTAAAIAHGVDVGAGDGYVLVFDLGGGTFDVTVMARGADGQLEVKGTGGDHRLGGADFDNIIAEKMRAAAQAEAGVDITGDVWAWADAKAKAVEVKIELSTLEESTRPLQTGGRPVMFTLTRSELNAMLADVEQSVADTVEYTIRELAGIDPAAITEVLMVGGSSRIPLFADVLRRVVPGCDPRFSRNMDEDVARGAAMLAAKEADTLDPRSALALLPAPVDAASHGLGITVHRNDKLVNTVLIDAGAPVPAKAEEIFVTHTDNQTSVKIDLNEGDSEDIDFVRQLGTSTGTFAAPVPKDHPVRVVMEYTVEQLIKVTAFDGDNGKQLCEFEVKHEGLMDADAAASAREYLSSITVR